MKKFLLLIITCLAFVGASAQTELRGTSGPMATIAFNFKTYTNYTGSTADTTGFIKLSEPVLGADFLLWNKVYLIGVATDSVAADVYVIGRNGRLTTQITKTYADSIKGTSNTLNTVVILVEGFATDRLPGCTQVRVGTVFRGSGNGTTTGRTMKWYFCAYKP